MVTEVCPRKCPQPTAAVETAGRSARRRLFAAQLTIVVLASVSRKPSFCRDDARRSRFQTARSQTVLRHLCEPTQGAVIVRLDRTIQYAAASRFHRWRLWNTGSPAGACHRARIRATRWRVMTGWDATSRSRGLIGPRFARNFHPSDQRAQGMPGARCAR
jgi:hypothetical protein